MNRWLSPQTLGEKPFSPTLGYCHDFFPPYYWVFWIIWPKISLLEALGSVQNYELLNKLLKLEHSNRIYVAC